MRTTRPAAIALCLAALGGCLASYDPSMFRLADAEDAGRDADAVDDVAEGDTLVPGCGNGVLEDDLGEQCDEGAETNRVRHDKQ